MRATPPTTDPEGYWCDPYWGCYTVGEAEYSNQFELSGGIVIWFQAGRRRCRPRTAPPPLPPAV